MVLSWRDGIQYDPQKIAENPGGLNYMPQFAQNGPGLDPNDHYILERNGLVTEVPKCYSPTNISTKLMQFGPLWFASVVPAGPHIRVIRGITGDQLYINDPSPVGTGSQYQSPFGTEFGAMETLGAMELGQASPVYLAHLP
jgi:hypothetical protein